MNRSPERNAGSVPRPRSGLLDYAIALIGLTLLEVVFGGRRRRQAAHTQSSVPPMSKRDLCNLHNLVLNRIYFESTVRAQRSYNFLTFNVFVGAGYVLIPLFHDSFPHNKKHPELGEGDILWIIRFFAYGIPISAFILALIQVACGKRERLAISIMRQYAWRIEHKLGIYVDRAIAEFYDQGIGPTGVVGNIMPAKPWRRWHRPSDEMMPWRRLPVKSVNWLLGIFVPQLIALAWAFGGAFMFALFESQQQWHSWLQFDLPRYVPGTPLFWVAFVVPLLMVMWSLLCHPYRPCRDLDNTRPPQSPPVQE